MVGWHLQSNGHELGQTLGDGEGQGSLSFCSPWNCRVRHDLVTEQQQHLENIICQNCIVMLIGIRVALRYVILIRK